MGAELKFNWVLQIAPPKILKPGDVREFSKDNNRVFPLNAPIDLIDLKREAIAKIRILEFNNSKDKTTGKYKILKVYEGMEKEILTNYWKENL